MVNKYRGFFASNVIFGDQFIFLEFNLYLSYNLLVKSVKKYRRFTAFLILNSFLIVTNLLVFMYVVSYSQFIRHDSGGRELESKPQPVMLVLVDGILIFFGQGNTFKCCSNYNKFAKLL